MILRYMDFRVCLKCGIMSVCHMALELLADGWHTNVTDSLTCTDIMKTYTHGSDPVMLADSNVESVMLIFNVKDPLVSAGEEGKLNTR